MEGHFEDTASQGQKNGALLLYGCPGAFSVLCCMFAISMVIILKLYKYFIYRLAMYQVLASLFQSLIYASTLMLLNYNSTQLYCRVICQVTAFFLVYAPFIKLMFTCWLTFHLFCYVVFLKNFKRLEWLYISSSLLIPLFLASVPFITKSYGMSGAWCYIRSWNNDSDSKEGIAEQFSFYYGPATLFLILSVIAIVIMIAVMVYRAHKSVHSRSGENQPLTSDRNQKVKVIKQLLPLLAYPIIYFMLLIFPLTNRIYMAASGSKDSNVILLRAHAVSGGLMGTFAALVLVIHICVMKSTKFGKRISSEEDHLSTFTGVTPYTSGAVTKFSLPNESDVDIAKSTTKNAKPCN